MVGKTGSLYTVDLYNFICTSNCDQVCYLSDHKVFIPTYLQLLGSLFFHGRNHGGYDDRAVYPPRSAIPDSAPVKPAGKHTELLSKEVSLCTGNRIEKGCRTCWMVGVCSLVVAISLSSSATLSFSFLMTALSSSSSLRLYYKNFMHITLIIGTIIRTPQSTYWYILPCFVCYASHSLGESAGRYSLAYVSFLS